MSIFGKKIGTHERAAMERRHYELTTRAQLSRVEARELDELEDELGKQAHTNRLVDLSEPPK